MTTVLVLWYRYVGESGAAPVRVYRKDDLRAKEDLALLVEQDISKEWTLKEVPLMDIVRIAFVFRVLDGSKMLIYGESKPGRWYREKFEEQYPGQVIHLQCADALSQLAKNVKEFHAPRGEEWTRSLG